MGLPAEKILLRDWLDRWVQEIIAPNRRQRTKERYEGIITCHIKPAIGHIHLAKLAPSHVQALESQLSTRGMGPLLTSLLELIFYNSSMGDWPPAPLLYGTEIIGDVRWAARTF